MNGKRWLPQHTKTLELMVSIGCDDGMIARQLGFCVDTVQRRRSALGLPAYYRTRQGSFMELRSMFDGKVAA